MTISFTTLGCKLNFAESSSLAKALIARGHTRAKQGEAADICIINTCSVTDTADHKDRQMIHRIRRQNPNAILIVTGCYAQLKPGEIADIEGVDYVLGQDEKFNLPDFIEQLESRVKSQESLSLPFGKSMIFMGRTARMTGRGALSRCRTDVTISALTAPSPWHAARAETRRFHR